MHGKNDFAEISKNLARCRSENNFVGDHQNNDIGLKLKLIVRLSKFCAVLCLRVLHYYFDDYCALLLYTVRCTSGVSSDFSKTNCTDKIII